MRCTLAFLSVCAATALAAPHLLQKRIVETRQPGYFPDESQTYGATLTTSASDIVRIMTFARVPRW